MPDNPSDPSHDHPTSGPNADDRTPVGRITDVRASLGQATMKATEVGDLLAAALAADDHQRLAQTSTTRHPPAVLRGTGGDNGGVR